MAIPKNVTFVTFDVYGTLIDWETGIYDAFAKEAARDDVEIDRAVLLPMFQEISREPAVAEALFDVLETQRILASTSRFTLLPSGPHSRILANLLAADGASKPPA